MLFLGAGLVVLVVIIISTLRVESLARKLAIFLGLGAVTIASLWLVDHDTHDVLHHVFVVDYPQFIMIPITTVFIASMNLFAVRTTREDVKPGWFLWLIAPIAGNFFTTWGNVPIGLSLVPLLKRKYPDTWQYILITVCIFSMNLLALGTLAADPPQALWAVKEAVKGTPLDFFFPLKEFWVYLGATQFLYFLVLKRLGVTFGSITELLAFRPESWGKFCLGIAVATSVAASIVFLTGYQVTIFLGATCVALGLVMSIFRKQFDHEVRHATMHWCMETAGIFVAFFSVVALAHLGFQSIPFAHETMIPIVAIETMVADNAAAFATGYPVFEGMDRAYMVWYNLFNAVTYGGVSPIGNGPQITLFLVIMVGMKHFSSGDVFRNWLREAYVFAPYLVVWSVSSSLFIQMRWNFGITAQLGTAIIALLAASEAMDLQTKFRVHMDRGQSWDGRTNGH